VAGSLPDAIRAKALELGFDAIGFTRADLGPELRDRLREFVASGQHGSMRWMADRMEARSHPRKLWPDARTVICVGVNYGPESDPLENLQHRHNGNISVYARNRDYHDVVKGMLKHLAQFVVSRGFGEVKVFVDTAPVMEKPLAARAGLGWQGKHTNLVSRRYGSWLFLGEIYTTLDIQPDEPSRDTCGRCTRCIVACPTNAFPGPYRLDATRCISYLTIEHQGAIPVDMRPAIGNRIYGCDDCLAVCPWNRFARASGHLKLVSREDLRAPRLADLARLDDAMFRTRFRGSPVKRIGRDRFVRNVAIAIGNSGCATLLPSAQKLATDADPVVADAGRWAVERIVR
jgi:epoxyqueuosine reductase